MAPCSQNKDGPMNDCELEVQKIFEWDTVGPVAKEGRLEH